MSNVIGIIGGAGVAATNRLLSLIEEKITRNGAIRDCDHPEIIVYYATKAPSRSLFLEGRGPSFYDDYISVANRLKEAGASIICMNCNTAHVGIDHFEDVTNVKFLNMVKEVVIRVRDSGVKTIGLIASDGCLKGKVYEHYFEEITPDVKIIYPDESLQRKVTEGICNIKNSCRFEPNDSPYRPKNIFSNVIKKLIDSGAELVVLGCTDISVDYKDYPEHIIDSTDVLSELIIDAVNQD